MIGHQTPGPDICVGLLGPALQSGEKEVAILGIKKDVHPVRATLRDMMRTVNSHHPSNPGHDSFYPPHSCCQEKNGSVL